MSRLLDVLLVAGVRLLGSVLVEGDQSTWHGVRHGRACVRMCPLLVGSGMAVCLLMLI